MLTHIALFIIDIFILHRDLIWGYSGLLALLPVSFIVIL